MAENNFRSDKLEEIIVELDIPLADDVKWSNENMIKAIGDYHLNKEPDKFSWCAKYVQSLKTVMLCKHMKDDLKNFDVNPIESDDYVAEDKVNGMRIILGYSPESGFEFFTRRESVQNYLNGNITDKLLFINKGVITEPSDYKNKFGYRFILDGEIIVDGLDNTPMSITVEDYIQSIFSSSAERAKEFQREGHRIKVVVFDVLYLEKEPAIPAEWTPKFEYKDVEISPDVTSWVEYKFGKYLETAAFKSAGRAKKLYQYLYTLRNTSKHDTRRFPFEKRRGLRHLLVPFLAKHGVPVEEVASEDNYKVSFLEEILASSGEGIILKNRYAPYISDLRSSRSHRAAMKVKQSIANMMVNSEMVEDFDVFITGANPPKSDRIKDMIGSLSCSIYIKEDDGSVVEHEIANVSGLSHEWKRKMAKIDVETGKISLNPEYLGKVIAVNGLALTASNLKFQHATLKDKGVVEFKAKNPSECVWDRESLKDMALVRGK